MSLNGILGVHTNFDAQCDMHPVSLHHTKRSSKNYEALAIKELTKHSRVFEYIPGRKHTSFPNIKPYFATCIDSRKLFKWIKKNQENAASHVELRKVLGHAI